MPNEEAIQKMSIVDPIQVNVNIPNFEGKPGRDGTDGRDGDDAYRIAVRNGFLGTEKEWLLTLKGQDGKSASAPTARQALLQNNVWCEDDTVDSVFTAIIGNWGKPMPRTEFKPLTIPPVVIGQKVVAITGEPHYKIKIVGYDELHKLNDNGYIQLQLPVAMDENDYQLEYYNYVDSKVGTATIKGQFSDGPADDTFEQDGIKYALYGRELHVNPAGFSGHFTYNHVFLGKWTKEQVDKILVKVARPTRISINASAALNTLGDIPVLVDNPVNFTIDNSDNYSTPIQLGSLEYGPVPTPFTSSEISWVADRKRYMNTGNAVDHL